MTWWRPVACLLATVWVTQPSAAAVEGYRYSRQIEVTSPGWKAIELEGAATSSRSLWLLDPGGREISLYGPSNQQAQRAVQIVDIEGTEDGWRIDMDLGASPAKHSRLYFDLEQSAVAARCRLEASTDGIEWSPLTTGSLFRIGPWDQLSRSALDYTPGRWRYLRLWWPKSTELPSIRRAAVAISRPVETTQIEVDDCRVLDDQRSRCWLETWPGVERVELVVDGEGHYGVWWSLYRSAGEPVSQSLEFRGPRAEITIEPEPGPHPPRDMRIDLWARAGGPVPRLLRASASYAKRAVYFEARTTGTFVLAYGGLQENPEFSIVPMSANPAWLEAGEESRAPWPVLPRSIAAAKVALSEDNWLLRWAVEAPGAAPGDLVELRLDETAAQQVRGYDWRLVSGDRQIPFARLDSERPASQAWFGLQPMGSGRSQAELDLGAAIDSSQSSLELFSRSGPFERLVSGHTEHPQPAGHPIRQTRQFEGRPWSCPASHPTGCVLRLGLRESASDQLTLSFDDGDNPPIAELTAELWTPTSRWLFIWPETDQVSLLAYADLPSPSYELDAYGRVLAERPRVEASVSGGGKPRHQLGSQRWLLPMAYALVAIVLIWLLRRLLTQKTD